MRQIEIDRASWTASILAVKVEVDVDVRKLIDLWTRAIDSSACREHREAHEVTAVQESTRRAVLEIPA